MIGASGDSSGERSGQSPGADRAWARQALARFEGTAQLSEILSAAFPENEGAPPAQCGRVIVGGGLAGLLLALRLSRDGVSDLSLIESEQALGGRLFFSTPWHGVGSPRSRFEVLIERGLLARDVSGPGFEAFTPEAALVVERHIHSGLREEERSFVDAFTSLGTQGAPLGRRCYVVKKEVTPLSSHTTSPTEIFTKKDSEAIAGLVEAFSPKMSEGGEGGEGGAGDEGEGDPEGTAAQGSSAEVGLGEVALADTTYWKELSKAQKENVTPLLEAVCGFGFLRFASTHVARTVRAFLDIHKAPVPALLRRDGGLELALEIVLRLRGVRVRTAARVLRVEKTGEGFHLHVGDDAYPSARDLTCKKMFLCMPLARSLSFLPREALSPGQSKMVSKYRPRSLVALEYPAMVENALPLFPEECRCGDVLFFSVERARGHVTSHGSLVLSAWLDYEDSLQAPSVREALARLRRAAARVLKPEVLRVFSGQGTVPVGSLTSRTERVVLLPVGLAAPQEVVPRDAVTSPKAAWPGLWVCGDGFTVSSLAWKNVIHSVHDAQGAVSKSAR